MTEKQIKEMIKYHQETKDNKEEVKPSDRIIHFESLGIEEKEFKLTIEKGIVLLSKYIVYF
jgi:hypothetical protein